MRIHLLPLVVPLLALEAAIFGVLLQARHKLDDGFPPPVADEVIRGLGLMQRRGRDEKPQEHATRHRGDDDRGGG